MASRKLKFDVRKTKGKASTVPLELVISLPRNKLTTGDDLVVRYPQTSYTTSGTAALHEMLMHSGITLPEGWICSIVSDTYVALFKLAVTPSLMRADFTHMITISFSGTWTLSVDRKEVNALQCPLLEGFPTQLLSVDNVMAIISMLDKCTLCVGNPDEIFFDLIEKYHGTFNDSSGSNLIRITLANSSVCIGTEVVAYHDNHTQKPTIRHSKCEVLVRNRDRCWKCEEYR